MRKVVLPGLAWIALACLVACRPVPAPLPTVSGAPKFPEFVTPTVPAALAKTAAAEREARGWTFLQAGDMRSAEREFVAALRQTPAFAPAETALGYVELARKEPKAALAHFDRVLEHQPADASALVGRGQAALALGLEVEALSALEAAVAADASLTDVKERVDVLRFRGLEVRLAEARAASRAGRLDEAARAYAGAIASSPDSAFLYRELAAVERQAGDAAAALANSRKAVALEPGDAGSLVQIGEILEASGDVAGAIDAYASALAAEPGGEVEAKLEAARATMARARLPAEFRAIDEARQITRADLAALVGVRLAPLLQVDRRRDAVLVTDVGTSWASTWILMVTRAGVMDTFDNHTFQPRAVVHRVDLAVVVDRLLTRMAASSPARAKPSASARLRFPDMAQGHIAYPAASAAVASGVLSTGPGDAFRPADVVGGAEAVLAMRRLEALAGLPSPKEAGR